MEQLSTNTHTHCIACAMFTTTRLAGRLGNAALLAAKDIGNTVYNLYSAKGYEQCIISSRANL